MTDKLDQQNNLLDRLFKGASLAAAQDISKIESQVFDVNGHLKILPYSFWQQFTSIEIRSFLHMHAIYVLPTTELISWFKENIEGETIEIGSGNGSLGRGVGVPMTDSYMQEMPEVKRHYDFMQQPTIKYASDVYKMDYLEAIREYKPNTVIGGYITHKWNGTDGNYYGVKEERILKKVDKYILVGNMKTHMSKPILKKSHEAVHFDWIITRGEQKLNRLFIWKKKN